MLAALSTSTGVVSTGAGAAGSSTGVVSVSVGTSPSVAVSVGVSSCASGEFELPGSEGRLPSRAAKFTSANASTGRSARTTRNFHHLLHADRGARCTPRGTSGFDGTSNSSSG